MKFAASDSHFVAGTLLLALDFQDPEILQTPVQEGQRVRGERGAAASSKRYGRSTCIEIDLQNCSNRCGLNYRYKSNYVFICFKASFHDEEGGS